MSPKLPLPILRPIRYLLPTRRSCQQHISIHDRRLSTWCPRWDRWGLIKNICRLSLAMHSNQQLNRLPLSSSWQEWCSLTLFFWGEWELQGLLDSVVEKAVGTSRTLTRIKEVKGRLWREGTEIKEDEEEKVERWLGTKREVKLVFNRQWVVREWSLSEVEWGQEWQAKPVLSVRRLEKEEELQTGNKREIILAWHNQNKGTRKE